MTGLLELPAILTVSPITNEWPAVVTIPVDLSTETIVTEVPPQSTLTLFEAALVRDVTVASAVPRRAAVMFVFEVSKGVAESEDPVAHVPVHV